MADQKFRNISELRKNYTKDGLVEAELPADPVLLFQQWFDEALESDVLEPNAMTLATADAAGCPNARTVLMKGIGERSIRFFSNYESRKGQEIEQNSNVTCVFWWGELERQVRIRGRASRLERQESEAYFQSRPRESQIGAWASSQSTVIKNRAELEGLFNKMEETFGGKEIPTPDYWGGYKIVIDEIEFWQGRPGRLHDRILYRFNINRWEYQRLSP